MRFSICVVFLATLGAAAAGCQDEETTSGADAASDAGSSFDATSTPDSARPCWELGNCPNPSEAGAPCSTDSDCPEDLYCGFEVHGGCSAPGSCRPRIPGGVGCGAPPERYVCDCQGKTLDAPVCTWPYSTVPSNHVGACDGGTDAALDARPD
jgi:hypothetical protein